METVVRPGIPARVQWLVVGGSAWKRGGKRQKSDALSVAKIGGSWPCGRSTFDLSPGVGVAYTV